MLLTERYASTTSHPACVVYTAPPVVRTVLGSVPPDMWDIAEKQDPIVKGDHITAMPYWSAIDRMKYYGKGDVSFRYQWRTTRSTSWDFPPLCHVGHQAATGIIDGTLSIYDYVSFPKRGRALPNGTPAQWLTCQHMADTKAMANLHKALVSIPLLIAERKETVSMIATRVAQMGHLVQDVAKRDLTRFKKAKSQLERRKVARSAANSHLELIFGLLPLIDEVEGLCEFLARPQLDFVRSRGLFVMAMGTETIDTTRLIASRSPINPVNSASLLCTVRTKGTLGDTISVRTALRYKLESQLAADASLLGFSPLGSGFDMVPLSFISGWFSNLDDWVRALDPVIGATFETGSRNRRQRTLVSSGVTLTPSVASAYEGKTVRWAIPPAQQEPIDVFADKQMNVRTVLSAPPEISLHWDVDVGLYELAAGLSLAIQRYVKPLKRLSKHKAFRYRVKRPKWLAEIRYTKEH